jgi:hypothetical protein
MVIDAWEAFARERGWRLSVERDPILLGRHEGIEIEAATHRALKGGWTTHVLAAPRLALHGSVSVEPARGWRRLRPAGPLPGFTVRSSSESVTRVVLDERVIETLRALGLALVELEYTPERVELSWLDTERDMSVLADAIACVAYLAVASGRTPYR